MYGHNPMLHLPLTFVGIIYKRDFIIPIRTMTLEINLLYCYCVYCAKSFWFSAQHIKLSFAIYNY